MTMFRFETVITLAICCIIINSCDAYQTSRRGSNGVKGFGSNRAAVTALQANGVSGRRDFLPQLVLSSLVFTESLSARADDGQDLTSKLFNPDGSLKEGVTSQEAKSRIIEFQWDRSDSLLANVDGSNAEGTGSGSQIRLFYDLPEKWGTGDNLYVDRSEGVNTKACRRITVYKAPGQYTVDSLDKATSIGVGKALGAPRELGKIKTSDIIGGRKQVKGEQKYYEFDMASAPATCQSSTENLGLGFCPYDTILLLSATILEDNLFVIAVECDNFEWKQGNAELKRVRSSFTVELNNS